MKVHSRTNSDDRLTDLTQATSAQQTLRATMQDEPIISKDALRGITDSDLALRLEGLRGEPSKESQDLYRKLSFEKRLRQLVGNVDMDENMREFLEKQEVSEGLRTYSGNKSIKALHLLGPAHCIAAVERRNWHGAGIEAHQTIHVFKEGQARSSKDLKTCSSHYTQAEHALYQIFGIIEVDYDRISEGYSVRANCGYGKEGAIQIMSDMTCKFNDYFEN